MEARRSFERDTVGFCNARSSFAPVEYIKKSLMNDGARPAAAFRGAEDICAVVTFGVKNPTGGVSHKLVANATTLLNPSLRDLIDPGETPAKQLQQDSERTQ
jgi:hypothetical protein